MSLDKFIAAIANGGGVSFSNGYDIEFNFPSTLKGVIEKAIGGDPNKSDDGRSPGLVKMFCDEAQLPNVQAATGQLNGRYLGENQYSYPYAKFYSDVSFSWMCDANMTPLKFLNSWHSFIFDGASKEAPQLVGKGATLSSMKSAVNTIGSGYARPVRLRYPKDYEAVMLITKTERSAAAPNARPSILYMLEGAYPYSIDSVPLSYGTSQITKVTANFYYSKHTVVYGDQRN